MGRDVVYDENKAPPLVIMDLPAVGMLLEVSGRFLEIMNGKFNVRAGMLLELTGMFWKALMVKLMYVASKCLDGKWQPKLGFGMRDCKIFSEVIAEIKLAILFTMPVLFKAISGLICRSYYHRNLK